jgi:hypothetical protein
MTGDLDLASPVQPELEKELLRHGLVRPGGPGHTPLGWIHPELALGIEIVASAPFDGALDPPASCSCDRLAGACRSVFCQSRT